MFPPSDPSSNLTQINCRMQRLTRLIKYVSLIIGPLATIGLVTVHVLIQSGQISVTNDVKTIKEFMPSGPTSAKIDDILKATDLPKKDVA